ncbi:MAG TPA: GNAT family N-acetyltransferase [Alphaproteobacteria bacterium]|nr:GNAT family N-acetyltransferase [Alphaproteobacteria bacterium]
MTIGRLDVTIRTARVEDAAAIGEVYVETWRTTYAGMVPDSVLLEMNEEIQGVRWAGIIERDRELVKVAEDARAGVVGMASGGQARRGSGFAAEVFTLYVLPDAQGAGIGRGILTNMFRTFRNAGRNSAIVWVLAANPARFFYEALGGERISEREERLWGANLPEIGYGWRDLGTALKGRLRS